MYNKQTLISLMKEYGFSDIKILDPGETQINSKHGLDLYAHSNNSIYLGQLNRIIFNIFKFLICKNIN